jgi:hypothetical protein
MKIEETERAVVQIEERGRVEGGLSPRFRAEMGDGHGSTLTDDRRRQTKSTHQRIINLLIDDNYRGKR